MSPHEKGTDVTLIANPASAGGKTAARIAAALDLLRTQCTSEPRLFVTRKRGDAELFTTSLSARSDLHLLVIMGGDGTIQEVANGLMKKEDKFRRGFALGLLSSGTGQGLAQSIGLPKSLRDQADILRRRYMRNLDVGSIRLSPFGDAAAVRYFVNEFQAGIGGEVVRRVETTNSKRFNGRITFGLEVLKVATFYPNPVVTLEMDGECPFSVKVVGIVVGNGGFTGGGMNLAVGADPWDGKLDLLIMKEQSFTQRVLNLNRIYTAKHVTRPEFELRRIRCVTIRSQESVEIEADGEHLGIAPAEIGIVPGALQIMTAEHGR